MMKLNKTNICLGAMLVFLGACAAPKPGTPEFVQKKEDEQQKAVVNTVKQSVDLTPAWFSKEPEDRNYIYGFASAVADSRQIAYDKATLAAKTSLASKLGDYVTGTAKNMIENSGTEQDAQTLSSLTIIQKSISKDIQLLGWNEVNRSTVPQNDKYLTFILLRYPLGEANKVLLSQIKRDQVLSNKLKASKAFEDLEREIDAAKKK